MLHEPRRLPAIVVGAGPAGLATSRELRRRNVEHVVLERGADVGSSWRSFYTSLVLHTGKHLSSLPGRPFGSDDPLFTPRAAFVDYLARYAAAEDLPVERGVEVTAAREVASGWVVETSAGERQATVLIVASGIASAPREIPVVGRDRFRGTVQHSIAYRDPKPFAGRRVLVVGAGNSAAEIASELGRAGIATTISVRSGVIVVPLTLAGVPSQYVGIGLRKLPRPIATPIARAAVTLGVRRRRDGLPRSAANPLDVIPIVGLHLSDALRSGIVRLRPGITELGESSARFADGSEDEIDDVILATGYRAAIGWLDSLVTRDGRGFARRKDRVVSTDRHCLLFVGHTYDAGGGLVNIRRDAPLAAEAAAAMTGKE